MNIQHDNQRPEGAFRLLDGTKQAGILNYRWDDSQVFTITHVIVDPAYGGQGLGKQLPDLAFAFARQEGALITPECPFAAKIMQRTPELHELLSAPLSGE